MRERILSEIRRLAGEDGGRPPGRQRFEAMTGIRQPEWYGVHWARWGEALAEAEFAPNQLQGRLDTDVLLEALASACRHFGRVPSEGDLRIYAKANPGFPSHGTFASHFGSKAVTIERLRGWVPDHPEFADVATLLGPYVAAPRPDTRARRPAEGHVYLIRSGDYHKIGRSEELERRVKEIRVALPAAAVLEHAIRTDDPAGIETYWHRRFADRRANGEWFKLAPADVAAFKRRKFQ